MTLSSWLVKLEPKFALVDVFLETPDMDIVSYLRDEWTGAVVHPTRPFPEKLRIKSWKDAGGYMCMIQRTGVRFAFAELDGFLVCFYEATSEVVYWAELNEWLKTNFPDTEKGDVENGWGLVHRLKATTTPRKPPCDAP